ncbi:solute carrier family 22 member 6-like [Contarinia nasturtii]|uniref:solute carrier family 22 member 6-like n=1 Tax=Contarinia nasturtii TaxID=265458 RepID=UPI0012D41D22|nr:solute carrier family 22 member 6-like [Contarinia nasturtii]
MANSPRKEVNEEKNDVQFILNDIGGAFGKFQIYNYLMCKISECDQSEKLTFQPDWLLCSTPFKNGHPDSCHRYGTVYDKDPNGSSCDVNSFNRSIITNCANGSMIFSTDELSIVNEFNLFCDENRWEIAMVGTFSSVGRLIFLPIIGYLSDRIGRKYALISSTLVSSVVKVLKSFSLSYNLFVVLEMLNAGINGAIYPTALICGMKYATTEYSTLVNCLIFFLSARSNCHRTDRFISP